MSRNITMMQAKNLAQDILEKNDLLTLPIDIDALASKKAILIDTMPENIARRAIYGALIFTNEKSLILYSTNVDNIGFQRFTIAHELGHYCLDGHLYEIIDEKGMHISDSDFCSKRMCEIEADAFASGLLMPEKLCKKLIAACVDGLGAIKILAEECWTSLTAAAIRYIDLTTAPSAVVVSAGNVIGYSVATREFHKYGTLPRKGFPLPMGTLSASVACSTRTHFQEGFEELESDLSLWIGGRRTIPCIEQSMKLGHTGKTLTLLTCIENEDEENEKDTDEDFERRWGLRFR